MKANERDKEGNEDSVRKVKRKVCMSKPEEERER